jgi:hypothetical protein
MRLSAPFLLAAAICAAADSDPMLTWRAAADFALTANPEAAEWKNVQGVVAAADRYGKPLPEARTDIRSRWTDQYLYFLFVSKFETRHPRPNPTSAKEAWGLWDYDVVEVFIGDDLNNINTYKEFEISPDGEFIDLDVNRDRKGKEVDWLWNSGVEYKTKIDDDRKVWVCEMRIPWKSIDRRKPVADNQLRLNLYRIEGAPPNRKYIAWRPVGNPSFHTPEKFGRLRLVN